MAAYPSRGLDIANTRRTQELLLEHRAGGAGVLVVSEDLDELMSLSDRIVVMHDGHIAGVVDCRRRRPHVTRRLMLGGGGMTGDRRPRSSPAPLDRPASATRRPVAPAPTG